MAYTTPKVNLHSNGKLFGCVGMVPHEVGLLAASPVYRISNSILV